MNKYAKAIVAGLSVAIAAAIPLVSDGATSVQDLLIIVGAGLAGAFPTWAVPNDKRNEDGVSDLGLIVAVVVLVVLVLALNGRLG